MNLLSNGGVVIVVGLKPNQIPLEYIEDDRFKFWSNPGNDATIARKELPSNCKAIVMTRFISHATFRSLTDQAKRKNITTFPIGSPREARQKLDQIIGKIPSEPFLVKQDSEPIRPALKPESTIVESPIKEEPIMKKGTVKNYGIEKFVSMHTDFTLPAGEDMLRLCKLLKEKRGLDYTPDKLRTSYFHAKRKIVGRIYKRPEPKVESNPKVEAFIQGELGKLLDSAILSLQLMKSEIERLDKLQKENAELKTKLSTIVEALKG